MSKKPAKAAADDSTNDGEAAPKKRSKLKLALFALVPLVLTGGGYAGWTFYFAPAGDAHAAAEKDGHEADGHAADGAEAAVALKADPAPVDLLRFILLVRLLFQRGKGRGEPLGRIRRL